MVWTMFSGQKDIWYFNSGKQQKVKGDEGNDECEWSKLLKEKQDNIYRGYGNGTVSFPPAVVDVDSHDPMGI